MNLSVLTNIHRCSE